MVAGAAILLFIESSAAYVRRPPADEAIAPGGGRGGDAEGDAPNLSLNGLIKSTFASLVHFLWNGPKHDPRTPMGKLALFALSFHTLVVAASYTASLAGFLATSSTLPIQAPPSTTRAPRDPSSPPPHVSPSSAVITRISFSLG